MARGLWALALLPLVLSCADSSECGRQHQCVEGECRYKALFPLSAWDWLGASLLLLTLACSYAAGVGGGVMVFPVFLIICNFDPHTGIPLVIASAVFGCFVCYLQRCLQRRVNSSKPVTDYEVAMLAISPLTLGVCYGARINQASPRWLLVVLIIVLLGYTAVKTFRLYSLPRGIGLYRSESTAKSADSAAPLVAGGSAKEPLFPAVPVSPTQLSITVLEFLAYVAFILLAGGKAAKSIIGVEVCSIAYWSLFAGYHIVVLAAVLGVAHYLLSLPRGNSDFQWTRKSVWSIAGFGLLSGLFGSMLMLGPGMVLGPALLALGTDPQVTSATSLFLIVLSASSSTLQYFIAGMIDLSYAGFFSVVAGLASVMGISMIKYIVKRYKRTSVIVLILAALAAASFVLVPVYDAVEIYESVEDGTFHSGFAPICPS